MCENAELKTSFLCKFCKSLSATKLKSDFRFSPETLTLPPLCYLLILLSADFMFIFLNYTINVELKYFPFIRQSSSEKQLLFQRGYYIE